MVLPLLPLLGAILPYLIPAVAERIAGEPAGDVARQVVEVAQQVTGMTEPDAVAQALATDPALAAQLRTRLAEIELEVIRTDAADRADARARHAAMRDRATPALAFAITAGFFAALGFAMAFGLPEVGREPLLVLIGSLATAWTAVVGFYFGTSNGARRSSDAINATLRR
jgi:hypothetical protein